MLSCTPVSKLTVAFRGCVHKNAKAFDAHTGLSAILLAWGKEGTCLRPVPLSRLAKLPAGRASSAALPCPPHHNSPVASRLLQQLPTLCSCHHHHWYSTLARKLLCRLLHTIEWLPGCLSLHAAGLVRVQGLMPVTALAPAGYCPQRKQQG